MTITFKENAIKVRELQDKEDDYKLLLKWLSDIDVCEYYEGRTKQFDLEMILDKFEQRAKGIDPVHVGIVEYEDTPIGFIQYYTTEPGEFFENDVIDMSNYPVSYGTDIIIGEKDYWNKGIGSQIVELITTFLFEIKKADIIFIAPQTWNKRAIRCYKKAGFVSVKIIEDMELHDDDYMDGVLMVKTKFTS